MTYVVVGNCHVHRIASSLSLMTETKTLTLRQPNFYTISASAYAEADKNLAEAIKIGVISTFWEDFAAVFPAHVGKASKIPHVHTKAFHPDIIEFSVAKKRIPSRMETSHSRLIIYGFLRDYSAEQTAALFNVDVYRALGYTDEWPRALAWARQQSEQTGWDVVNLYEKWKKVGCFVYTPCMAKSYPGIGVEK